MICVQQKSESAVSIHWWWYVLQPHNVFRLKAHVLKGRNSNMILPSHITGSQTWGLVSCLHLLLSVRHQRMEVVFVGSHKWVVAEPGLEPKSLALPVSPKPEGLWRHEVGLCDESWASQIETTWFSVPIAQTLFHKVHLLCRHFSLSWCGKWKKYPYWKEIRTLLRNKFPKQ